MGINTSLRQFLVERLTAYDPALDTSAGSSLDSSVIQPIIDRVGSDPLEISSEQLIKERINYFDPDISTGDGSTINSIIVKPASMIADPLRQAIQVLRRGQSMKNPESLTEEEMDLLVANLFVTRSPGLSSTGRVRLYYREPTTLNISLLVRFRTADNKGFFPATPVSVTQSQMELNVDGNYFYVDVTVMAEERSEEYDVEPSAVQYANGLSPYPTKIRNLSRFRGGRKPETNSELADRARSGISVRDLATTAGINYQLREKYPFLTALEVVGYGDAEMLRDRVTGTNVFTLNIEDVAIGICDGDEDTLYELPIVPFESITNVYLEATTGTYTGEKHTVEEWTEDPYNLDISWLPDPSEPYEYVQLIGSDVQGGAGATIYSWKISGDWVYLGSSPAELYLGGMPGGILGPDPSPIPSNEVAVGGKTDIYLKESELSRGTVDLRNVSLQVTLADSDPTSSDNLVIKPFVRLVTVEQLDANSNQPSGVFMPKRDPVDIRTSKLSGGGGPYGGGVLDDQAVGSAFVYFIDPTTFSTTADTVFIDQETDYEFEPQRYEADNGSSKSATFYPSTEQPEYIPPTGYNVEATTAPGSGGADWSSITVGSLIRVSGSDIDYYIESVDTTTEKHRMTIRLQNDVLPHALYDEYTGAKENSGYSISPGITQEDMLSQGKLNCLYYMEVKIIAKESGSDYNLPDNSFMRIDLTADFPYYSEGWWLETESEYFSFTVYEGMTINFSPQWKDRTALVVGNTFQLTYDYADSLAEIQDMALSDSYRILSEDILIRHVIPLLVMFRIGYAGGTVDQTESLNQLRDYVENLHKTPEFGTGKLDVFQIQSVFITAGVTNLDLPIEVVAIMENQDRTSTAYRSTDNITLPDRVSRFVLDDDHVVLEEI